MGSRDISTHLRPHVLPPLDVRGFGDSGTINHLNASSEKGVRQRIGTPAPRKTSPIPDDLDLNKLNIKVDSCKADEMQKHYGPPEKAHKLLTGGGSGSGITNLNFRLRKTQLEPIVTASNVEKVRKDRNGNRIDGDFWTRDSSPEKIHLPNRYAPLKPIARKTVNLDDNS